METKILVALCALILSLGSNVEGQDPGAHSSPSDGPLTLGMSGAVQAPLPGGSPSPPGSLSLPSTDSPKPGSNLTDGGLSNNNSSSSNSSNSSSNDTAVVVVKEVPATSVGVPAPTPIPEKTPGPENLTEETVQPSDAPSDNHTAPTHTPTTTVLVHKPSTTPTHTPVYSTTPSSHAPHPSKTHSPITTTASPAPTRLETHPTNTSAAPQPSSTPSPNPDTSNPIQPKQPLSPFPTTTTTTSPPALPTSEPQTQTSSITPLPASTPASSPPSQAKTHADIPSQLNVVEGEPVFHSGGPALDPLLAGLVSVFIVTAAIITLLLFIKMRRRDQRPEFRRLQDLPMDDMMEDTPLSMYSY
ncbi:mucin-2-like [Salvelinus namaycush]|uniref:Mucin-2-like n=1 Tax=Salvelinus namaycush TaxID=8040 RepID=A0A8U1ERE8_SALNM|nr:mucin-2-like [Salvelinus namaycush]